MRTKFLHLKSDHASVQLQIKYWVPGIRKGKFNMDPIYILDMQ